MNSRHPSFILVAAMLLPCSAFAQGTLTPPGPPAPTMKTLDQVEARIPIDAIRTPGDAGATFRITAPGSYYLTGNVTGESDKVGILVAADNVTIDLNGFSLNGPGNSSGIDTPPGATGPANTTVRNGTISKWAAGAVLRNTARVEKVNFLRNTRNGLECGEAALIVDCIAIDNVFSGIMAGKGAMVRSAVAHDNGVGISAGPGAVVTNCAANLNTVGIETEAGSTVQGCSAESNFSTGISGDHRSTIVDCTSTNNGVFGIAARDSSVIQRCIASKNRGEAGIKVANRCQVIDCVADENGNLGSGDGISANQRTVVKRCSATGNQRNGITVTGESVVIDNRASENGRGLLAAGIFTSFGGATGSRIEGNHTRDNFGDGIRASAGDVIIRNTAGNNSGANFNPASGPNFGPIQAPATATSPTANHQF